MSRNITEVDWGYSGRLPNGISFDEITGTFSGTPTKVGEYTIPVTVWTNYGEDTKDVKIVVEKKDGKGNVFGIGRAASMWSGYEEPDEDGFYNLNVPRTKELVYDSRGFGAITCDNNYYYGQTQSQILQGGIGQKGHFYGTCLCYSYIKQDSSKYYSSSFDLEVIMEDSDSSLTLRGGTGEITEVITNPAGSGSWKHERVIFNPTNDIVLGDGNMTAMNIFSNETQRRYGYFLVSGGEKVCIISAGSYGGLVFDVRYLPNKAIKVFNYYNSTPPVFQYFYENGTLDNDPNNFQQGIIQNAWVLGQYAYVLTTTNQLYEYVAKSKTFELQGNYGDIKKFKINTSSIFFLTNDGKLYHKGKAVTDVTDAHTSFTQIFQNCRFHDLAFDGSTLIVIKE